MEKVRARHLDDEQRAIMRHELAVVAAEELRREDGRVSLFSTLADLIPTPRRAGKMANMANVSMNMIRCLTLSKAVLAITLMTR